MQRRLQTTYFVTYLPGQTKRTIDRSWLWTLVSQKLGKSPQAEYPKVQIPPFTLLVQIHKARPLFGGVSKGEIRESHGLTGDNLYHVTIRVPSCYL